MAQHQTHRSVELGRINPIDDLRQILVIGLLKAPDSSYANDEISHYLRNHGYAIKVPPSWRDLYASGQKLLREGLPPHAISQRLGISGVRWWEIQEACSITVIALQTDS